MSLEMFTERYRSYEPEQKNREFRRLIARALRYAEDKNARGLVRLRGLLTTSYLTSQAQEVVFEDIKAGSGPDSERIAEDEAYFNDRFLVEGRSIFQPTSAPVVETDLYLDELARHHFDVVQTEGAVMNLTEEELSETGDVPSVGDGGQREFLEQWRQEIINKHKLELPTPYP